MGAHSLSGAVLESGPLEALLPNWRTEYTGMKVPAAEDDVRLMTRTGSFKLPNWAVNLSPMNNHGNFIISLGQLTPWMASQAEALGIDIFPGFAAAEAVFDENGAVKGVRIGDMGLEKNGEPGPNYTPGVEIHAGTTVLAEGSRGSMSKQLIAKYNLREGHRSADVRPGLQGTVAIAAGPREAGPHRACVRLAARYSNVRRQLPLSPR